MENLKMMIIFPNKFVQKSQITSWIYYTIILWNNTSKRYANEKKIFEIFSVDNNGTRQDKPSCGCGYYVMKPENKKDFFLQKTNMLHMLRLYLPFSSSLTSFNLYGMYACLLCNFEREVDNHNEIFFTTTGMLWM